MYKKINELILSLCVLNINSGSLNPSAPKTDSNSDITINSVPVRTIPAGEF